MPTPNFNLSKQPSQGGFFGVYVDGSATPISTHDEESEAAEAAINQKLLTPDADVVYRPQTYQISVSLSDYVPDDGGGGGGGGGGPVSGAFLRNLNGDIVDGDDNVFQFNGTNAYYLPNYQVIDEGVVDRAIAAFENAGVRAVRMWGFYDGPPQYSGDASIQPLEGTYNENSLRALDEVIYKGKQAGIRFILPFINYWEELGGIAQYVEWATGTSEQNMNTFINNAQCQQTFRDYISMLLNRENTFTNIAYKDEPAILCWEIGNELRNPGQDPTEIRDWYQTMAQYIKSIDSNHMVCTGEEGFDEGTPVEYSEADYSNTYVLRANEGTSYILNTAIPEIDIASCHWYPTDWGFGFEVTQSFLDSQEAFIMDHHNIAQSSGKPMFVGEYGFPGYGDADFGPRMETMYGALHDLVENNGIGGSLLWQLAADWVKCWEYGGNICYPAGRVDTVLYNQFLQHSTNLENI